MKKTQVLRFDQLGRIIQFVLDHPIVPAIPRATVLLAEVNTLHTGLLAHGSGQEGGSNTYRSGVSQRRALRESILTTVTEMSQTAQALDPAQHPGVRDLFRLNKASNSYQRLINTGSAFLDEVADASVKALFTDRGFDVDFDVQLTAKLTALAAATGIKWQGRQVQKTGTVGLDVVSRRVSRVVRELSGIMVKYLQTADPGLIPVWLAAARAYVPAVTNPETPAGGSEAGSGTPPPAGS